MSALLKLVDSLEVRLHKLVSKLEEKEQINQGLLAELAKKEAKIKAQEQELIQKEEQFSTLKLTNSMLGSEEYKRETKLKINALIKEIDHCITQLSK
ncbi:hypothetical protein [Pseudofulvibacter geojedonensis]|uniref:Phenylalanyl-tRNA synthetase subunit beta n=1 Tax=Pseudofulvibacter geojedonensis TaxID=1123758 RepID=A0ABW3HY81_9FLAO